MPVDEAPSFRIRNWWEDVYGVFRLSLTMLSKLKKNRHKAHWLGYGNFDFYMGRLFQECEELDSICLSPTERQMEAADVANFAMMIHERARCRAREQDPDA